MTDRTRIEVTAEDVAPLFKFDKAVGDLQRDLGALREEYLMTESRLMNAVVRTKAEADEAVVEVAKKYDLDLSKDPQWYFDLAQRCFVKRVPRIADSA